MAIDTEVKRRMALNSSIRGTLLPVPVSGISFGDRAHVSWAYYAFQSIKFDVLKTYTHFWEFGDGEVSAEENPSHIYTTPGVYTVSHTVTDQDGNSETEIKVDYIVVTQWDLIAGGRNVDKTNKCYRFGFTTDQGLGFSECSGDSWPMPEGRTGVLSIFDASYYPHLLVLDSTDGMFYDIATFNGPTGSDLEKVWKDKVGTDGSGGTNIIPEVLYGEDTGSDEDFFIRALQNYFYTRPIDESKRNTTGYNANGYPNDLELEISIFADGNPTTSKVVADNIELPKHMISFDKKAEGNRLQTKIVANNSEIIIIGRAQHYVAADLPTSPDKMLMQHDDYQSTFSSTIKRVGYYKNNLVDRRTGIVYAAAGIAKVAGPISGGNSAMSFSTAQNFGSVNVSLGSIMMWYQGTIVVSIGSTVITLTDFNTYGSWKLGYAINVSGVGNLVVTPTGLVKLFDALVINSEASLDAIGYYYNDVSLNSGNNILPR
jgi:PKD repeat protein